MEQNLESKGDISISLATPEDVVGIQEVYKKTWLETYPNDDAGITRDDIEDFHKDILSEEKLVKRAEQIANPQEGHTLLIAKEGDKVIGVCQVVATKEQNRLRSLYVLPEYQRRGVGKKLWLEARKHLDPKRDVVLSVATYNQRAIEFYENLGFKNTLRCVDDDRFTMKSGNKIPQVEMRLMNHEERQA